MLRVERSIEIQAPPEKVWPFLADPEKVPAWYTPVQAFRYTGEPRSGVGAPFYFEEEASGLTAKLNCEVTEWVENEVFAFQMTSGNLGKSYGERWTLEPTPAGSRFTFVEQVDLGLGILHRVVGPLFERTSGATVDKILAGLKALAEA